MAEPEIYANPQRLVALAEELRLFTNSIRVELERLDTGVRGLGSTWQDQEYKKFKRLFETLKEDLAVLDREISRREPELRSDAQLLRDYLAK